MKTIADKFFIAKTHNTYIQLMRYCFAGGLSFIVDFCILFALTDFLHINYLASAPVAFVFGLITKYIVSIRWVFHRRVFTNSWVQFSIFAFIGLVGLILNEAIIWLFTEFCHFHYLLSKIISGVSIFLWSFLARKFILFR